jgi:branched-chain amino acid transport system substrate-binding protein
MSFGSRARRAAPALAATVVAALALLAGGCSGGDLKVVVILPETGHLADYGKDLKRGAELAAREAQQPGGVLEDLAAPLQLEFIDDGSNPDRALLEVQRALKETTPFAVLGPVHGEAWLGAGLDAEEAGISLVSPWVSVPASDYPYKSLFRNYASDEVEAARLAKLLRRDLDPRVKDLAVITELSDYGRGYKAAFGRAFKRLQGNVETSMHFERGLEAGQAAALVEELRIRPAGGCLLVATGPDLAVLLQALRDITYSEQIFTTAALHHPAVRARAGELAQDVIYVAPAWQPEADFARGFTAAYRDETGEAPSLWAGLGHDALAAILQGAADMGGAYRTDLSGLMRSLDFEAPGVVSGKVRYDTAGECSDCPLMVFGVRDGTALPWEAYEEHWNARHGSS